MRSGNNKPPSASMVTPEPPVKAVKNPHKSTIITGVPPGIHPNNSLKTDTSLTDALLSANKYPAKVKSGMVGNVGDTTILYVSVGIAEIGVNSDQNSKTAMPPNPTNIGAPKINDTKIIKDPIHTTGTTVKIALVMALIDSNTAKKIKETL